MAFISKDFKAFLLVLSELHFIKKCEKKVMLILRMLEISGFLLFVCFLCSSLIFPTVRCSLRKSPFILWKLKTLMTDNVASHNRTIGSRLINVKWGYKWSSWKLYIIDLRVLFFFKKKKQKHLDIKLKNLIYFLIKLEILNENVGSTIFCWVNLTFCIIDKRKILTFFPIKSYFKHNILRISV